VWTVQLNSKPSERNFQASIQSDLSLLRARGLITHSIGAGLSDKAGVACSPTARRGGVCGRGRVSPVVCEQRLFNSGRSDICDIHTLASGRTVTVEKSGGIDEGSKTAKPYGAGLFRGLSDYHKYTREL
jgi:hypothetical protein